MRANGSDAAIIVKARARGPRNRSRPAAGRRPNRGSRGQHCQVIGLIAIADAARPTAKAAVAKLRERGIEVVMLTGDNAGTAKRIAAGVLYPFVLSPAIAALSMSGSSAVVAINALLLKRTKLAGIHRPDEPGKKGAPTVAETPPADHKEAACLSIQSRPRLRPCSMWVATLLDNDRIEAVLPV